ncbi:PucR family transcriptional regulator [Neobacillus sp. LXY-1]|uniref:PucR family transcriptional regulator n=1 Tax=Neobacillus sp. LXY-1 TaxID=3379133 RepID=UPI003EE07035
MLKKLLSLYKNSYLLTSLPEKPLESHFVFFAGSSNQWISIPKEMVSDKEVHLLNTLFELVEYHPSQSSLGEDWHRFLLQNGPVPRQAFDGQYRFIQFHINGNAIDHQEIEAALKGFFVEDVVIVWESSTDGVVVEAKKQISLSDEELVSISETLESDFFIKTSFYIGKLYYFSTELPNQFLQEKDFFQFGIQRIVNTPILTYERVFPAYLAAHLPKELKQKISKDMIELFVHDPELFDSIKVFLENNSNASLTAKKLYIHRNTLQYRLDKFVEKTGIDLKDFYGAFTVFLACQLFEQES